MTPEGRAAARKLGKRQGPEPSAAVKDAFGAAFGRAATPAFGGRCATHACVSRFGRWSTIGFDGDAWPCRPAAPPKPMVQGRVRAVRRVAFGVSPETAKSGRGVTTG